VQTAASGASTVWRDANDAVSDLQRVETSLVLPSMCIHSAAADRYPMGRFGPFGAVPLAEFVLPGPIWSGVFRRELWCRKESRTAAEPGTHCQSGKIRYADYP